MMVKKLTLILTALIFLGVAPAMADLLIASSDGVATDQNKGSNPENEKIWLETVTGSQDLEFIGKFENPNDNSEAPINKTSFENFTPGNDNVDQWDYAIVKIGGGNGVQSHYAFMDNGDGILSPLDDNGDCYNFNHEISHISFFRNTNPIPEPTIMLLLGAGLVGLAGLGRKKFHT